MPCSSSHSPFPPSPSADRGLRPAVAPHLAAIGVGIVLIVGAVAVSASSQDAVVQNAGTAHLPRSFAQTVDVQAGFRPATRSNYPRVDERPRIASSHPLASRSVGVDAAEASLSSAWQLLVTGPLLFLCGGLVWAWRRSTAGEGNQLLGVMDVELPRHIAMATVASRRVDGKPEQQAVNKLTSYVQSRKGNLPIRKVLIANNGMAATKFILSVRTWAYMELGDDRAIEFVAMATPEDLRANARFLSLADYVVEVPAGSNKNNYANVPLIIATAVAQGVDAVWPGWGHASENPALSDGLKAKGVKFIGPPGRVMAALGDKIAANILAQSAKVPCIPWSGDGLTVDAGSRGVIPKEVFDAACVTSVEQALAAADRIGYPIMIKASEGGGGKGIRMAKSKEETKSFFEQVCNEVPGSPVFMMQLCTGARHIEVQIVGDEHGNAVALNGRDCSTQRRFQKIFEEGPPTITPPDVFRQMELSALRLTQSIGYCGAGTVEYLYQPSSNSYYFLELNPRLQVEHPVTEDLTGVNLPATQLQVAMGIPLPNIPDVRRFYNLPDPYGYSPIHFAEDSYKKLDTHVIAARITAENPDESFKPTSGSIREIRFRSTPKVWGYFSVGSNGGIHEFADSQFGHLFSRGVDRDDARKHLVLALKEMVVLGEIRTPIEYLVKLLETEAFQRNTIDTSWLDGLLRERKDDGASNAQEVVLAAVIFRAFEHCKAVQRSVVEALQKGQLSMAALRTANTFPVEVTYKGLKYTFEVSRTSANTFSLTLNGTRIPISVRQQADNSLLCSYGGALRFVSGMEEPLGLRVVINGLTYMIPNVIDPSELRSDVNGRLVRFLQKDGAQVEKSRPYAEVEAMKMIMSLTATESGAITHLLTPGSIISPGDQLAALQLTDPSRAAKVQPFTGTIELPADGQAARKPYDTLELVLDGYDLPDIDMAVQAFMAQTTDPAQKVAEIDTLLQRYMDVEKHFVNGSLDDSVLALVKANKDNLAEVVRLNMAHLQLRRRNALVCSLMRQASSLPFTALKPVLSRLAQLPGGVYGEVALAAARMLDLSEQVPFEVMVEEVRQLLRQGKEEPVDVQQWLLYGTHHLAAVFADADKTVALAGLQAYVQKFLYPHTVLSLSAAEAAGNLVADWEYRQLQVPVPDAPVRCGHLAVLPAWDPAAVPAAIAAGLERLRQRSAAHPKAPVPVHSLHLGFAACPAMDVGAAVAQLEPLVAAHREALQAAGVAQVYALLPQFPNRPIFLTFSAASGYKENPLGRTNRPGLNELLELARLGDNYQLEQLPTISPNSRMYLGTEKNSRAGRGASPQALFLRAITYNNRVSVEGAERILLSGLDELERCTLDPRVSNTASSRVFLTLPTPLELGLEDAVEYFKRTLDALFSRYAPRLLKLRVDEIEVVVQIRQPDGSSQPLRLTASSVTGEWLRLDAWLAYANPITGVTERYCTIASGDEQVCSLDPYPMADKIGTKRANARRVGSTYAYDFLGLLNQELIRLWGDHLDELSSVQQEGLTLPSKVFEAQALQLRDGTIAPTDYNVAGSNDIGMVAWLCRMKTPEYPEGREIVLIANDVTVQNGSFGVREDEFFERASEYARRRGLPRVYIACNSGARIGLIDDLKPKFRVAFKNAENPTLGYEYLYLTEADYSALPPGTVEGELIQTPTGEKRFRLSDIIGQENGIGVENLRGSGLIAGETSRAYQDAFTLSYVTGRSVGIGAYLLRLGQRVIQNETAPIILTGHQALNSVLGREVYTSMDQLGGPQIMFNNGVSHQVVATDQEGVKAIVQWLSYVPKDRWASPPVLPALDPVERDIVFTPTKTAYDPRHMIAGAVAPDGTWLPGFFDRGSFTETMANWGKSVVAGRARLGGIPFGVIAVETRMVEQRIPADPANPDSRESILPQAGQVWYPDSAYKTAQAINDFNRGENLPLMVFANWRGFSGGTRDMFGEILKFGAMIVDALVAYKHPVFVYIPPNAELRGGAWVVIDPTINLEVMEMYADPESRGGILEPAGIAAIKFRQPDQTAKMHQVDAQLQAWDEQLRAETDPERKAALQKQIADREVMLMPLYLQIAHEFADLHDRSGRMKAKGVIRDVVPWKRAREYFYWRALRRIKESELLAQFRREDPQLSHAEMVEMLQQNIPGYHSDKEFLSFVHHNGPQVAEWAAAVRRGAVKRVLSDLLSSVSREELQESLAALSDTEE